MLETPQVSDASKPAFLACRITPRGKLVVVPDARGEVLPSARTASRIARAFEKGTGAGLLHLGLSETSTQLPPAIGFWRQVASLFLTSVCRAADPLDSSKLVVPEPDLGELTHLAEVAPPMPGGEFLDGALLQEFWREMAEALRVEVEKSGKGLKGFLRKRGSNWHMVGRVCLHLAENKRNQERPFAFLATYVENVGLGGRPQHLPLGRALQEYAGARNRRKLLALLAPLSRAAEKSTFLRKLVESGDIYHPLAWTPKQAYQFLCEVDQYEQAGLVVRIPDWWSSRQRPRPKVTVSVGKTPPASVGLSALLDFDVRVTLNGEELSQKELQELLAATSGLVLLRGQWVEVDREKLSQVLDHWRVAQHRARTEGLSLGEAMRLLAGVPTDGTGKGPDQATRAWSEVVAGDWLASRLEALRARDILPEIEQNAGLKATLRPYQKEGAAWLWTLRSLRLGGCLADDMGLGKTIQVLAVLNLARQEKGTDLLVAPASLLENWRLEIKRFAPKLKVLVAHRSQMPASRIKNFPRKTVAKYHLVMTSYATAARTPWMQEYPWRSIILDEAQSIKNPGTKQTRALKAMKAEWRLALTGTPVENSLGDLWSIFDFLNPGLLGSAAAFKRACKAMAENDEGYAPLRRLIQPYLLRRLKTDERILPDLPDKTEVTAYCLLTKKQAALYAQAVQELQAALRKAEGIQRRGLVLSTLMRLKQICNHPSHWLGDGRYEPQESGKFHRLRGICESIAARQEKVLVFTQFREMTGPLAAFLGKVFGRPGLMIHGGVPVRRRQSIVQNFQEDERIPFLVLSLKVGGTGLNLTAASHVIHFDRWWNPAVENQATDRAFRIGQKKNVLVHKFVCGGTVEERIHELLLGKKQLAEEVLSQGAERALTELSDEELLEVVSLDLDRALQE